MRSAPKTTTSKPNLKAADKSNTVGVKNNDANGVARTRPGFEAEFGAERIVDTGPVTGSGDVRILARAAGVPCVYWLLGGADPQRICRRY